MSASTSSRQLSPFDSVLINLAFVAMVVTVFRRIPEAGAPPWAFSGWAGTTLSTLFWAWTVFIAVAMGGGYSFATREVLTEVTTEGLGVLAFLGGVFLALTFLLTFCELDSPAPNQDPVQSSTANWKSKKAELEQTQDRLTGDVQQLVEQLHEMGIHSRADIKANPVALELVEELRELLSQGESVTNEIERIDVALVRAESKLRRI